MKAIIMYLKVSKFTGSNAFQITAQVLTVSGLLLATYVTVRLFPLVTNLNELNFRVTAIEERNEQADPLIERFIVVEEKEAEMSKKIEEIKETVRDINIKVDRLLER